MGATTIPFGSLQSLVRQSVGLFAATMQRKTILNRLCGQMPQQKDAENKLKVQSSTDYPIVRNMDLTKFAGDRITFDLVNPTNGLPIMGDAYAQGLGDAMTFAQDGLHINVTRKPVSAGSTMSQQRTLHQLLGLARANAFGYMSRLEDQRTLIHLAGARGFANNGEWAVPLQAHAKFAEIMINTVKAPSHNRHFMANGGNIVPFAASANAVSIQTTDQMSIDLVDSLATWLDGAPFAPGAVKFDGDELAEDAPLRVLLVSAEQYNGFLRSGLFRQLQAQSTARASAAKQNPIMLGDAGLWRGILIVKMPKPIRFYAGNEIKHCASTSSQTETTGDLVPSSFGTTFAVDRALLLGGQALGQALGKAKLMNKSGEESLDGMPMFYSEEIMDHGARPEVLLGLVNGMSKIQFLQDFGTSSQYTDFGVVAIDTAVAIAGVS
jgi:N4-gp56 family major capsid protein